METAGEAHVDERNEYGVRTRFDQWIDYAAIALLPLVVAAGIWELASLG